MPLKDKFMVGLMLVWALVSLWLAYKLTDGRPLKRLKFISVILCAIGMVIIMAIFGKL